MEARFSPMTAASRISEPSPSPLLDAVSIPPPAPVLLAHCDWIITIITGPVILAANAAIGSATFTGQAYVDGNISGNHELEIIPRYGNWNTKVYLSGDNTYGSTRLSGGSATPYSGSIGELIANSAT